MAVAQRSWAEIHQGLFKNVIIADNYEIANQLARATYDNTAFAVEVTDIPAIIGDSYTGGKFYREIEGVQTEIAPIPSAEVQLEELKQQMAYMFMKNRMEIPYE